MMLMGMKMSLTKKPTNPTTTKPIAVRAATLVNSARIESNRSHGPSDPVRPRSQQHTGMGAGDLRVGLVAGLDEAGMEAPPLCFAGSGGRTEEGRACGSTQSQQSPPRCAAQPSCSAPRRHAPRSTQRRAPRRAAPPTPCSQSRRAAAASLGFGGEGVGWGERARVGFFFEIERAS
jgi:hypothetical protein